MSGKSKKTAIVISVISLVVALVGGVPGVLEVYKYLTRSSVEVGFSEGQSFMCPISSDKAHLNGKMAVGFYDLYVMGRGSEPTPIKNIDFYLNHKGKWIKGTRFSIHRHRESDGKGGTWECILLASECCVIHVSGWDELLEGDVRKIEYVELGHHVRGTISYYFDLKANEIKECKKLKFVVTDYFDNEYTYVDQIPNFPLTFLDDGFEVIDKEFNQ
jgi:hypothetical protein